MTRSMNAAVRTARQDDLQSVLDVHARQGSRPDGPPSVRERAAWGRMMGTVDLHVYIVEVEDAIAGTATAMTMPNVTYGGAPTVFIEAVVVRPDDRRSGLATAMVERILDDARAAGCNKVQLLSHKRHASDGAHRFYRNLGFEPEAEGFRLYLTGLPPELPASLT